MTPAPDGSLLRLMTWNCRGFRTRSEYAAAFRPDVLIVQELGTIDVLRSDIQPTFRHRIPPGRQRGLAALSYTDTKIQYVAPYQGGFHRFEVEYHGLRFHLVGVWTSTRKPQSTSYRQAHDGLKLHSDWIRERPTVLLGDFNNHGKCRERGWDELIRQTESLGLVSAYHAVTGERFGEESNPTYFCRKGDRMYSKQLDYCFLPQEWSKNIVRVWLGSYEDWRTLSDHVPLVVDLNLGPG